MVGTTLDLEAIISRENLAVQIAENYITWNNLRAPFLNEIKEIRNYAFATDTSTTSNKVLPWGNTTTIPKLAQIRENLHANYMAALFPNRRPIKWEGDNESAEGAETRTAIQNYMDNKLRRGGFKQLVSQLIYDWIDTGNVFVTTEWVNESTTDPFTEEEIPGFIGPKAKRISIFDIVFNPTSIDFTKTPKIIRSVKTIGELKRDAVNNPGDEAAQILFNEAVNKAIGVRQAMGTMTESDIHKQESFVVDGFSSLHHYYGSGFVEILEFHGDLYDMATDELFENRVITILDRSIIAQNIVNPNWFGRDHIKHSPWKTRSDNLYGMGPLANIVGMQYRIDHLENKKADALDMTTTPMLKIRGHVEDFDIAPGERIYEGDEGSVEYLRPDTTAILNNNDIDRLLVLMEEMAGAPKQAMGIRTPGEKTKFEVQILENPSNRIFLNKIAAFDEQVIEPLLNDMLEQARRNLTGSDVIRVLDNETEAVLFSTIKKEDITAKGMIKASAASTFADRANKLQNLIQLYNSALGNDPAVNVHFSGKRIAKLITELMDLEDDDIIQDNIRIEEQLETQRLASAASEQLEVEEATPSDIA